jgi:hypothetical protein
MRALGAGRGRRPGVAGGQEKQEQREDPQRHAAATRPTKKNRRCCRFFSMGMKGHPEATRSIAAGAIT